MSITKEELAEMVTESIMQTMADRGMSLDEQRAFVAELREMEPLERLTYWKPTLKEALVRLLFDIAIHGEERPHA